MAGAGALVISHEIVVVPDRMADDLFFDREDAPKTQSPKKLERWRILTADNADER